MTDEHPVPLNEQILALSKLTGQMRTSLQTVRSSLPPDTLEGLSSLENNLFQVSKSVTAVEEERSKLLALAGTTQAVNSSLELDEVLQLVMDTIIRITEAERGFLMLRDAQGEMATRVARNWEQESINPNEFAISRTIIQRVIESGEPVLTTNAQEDPRFGGQESIVAYNLRSILCVPLKAKTETIGVIYADNRIRSGIFKEAEKDLLTVFANQAAIAIENARLFASVRRTLAEVTELKNLMDNVFSSIASGVLTADVKDQITLCNRAAESILGRTIPDLVGHRLEEVLPALAGEIRAHLMEVRDTDKPLVGLEITHNHPERGALDWRLNLSPLKDAEQTTQGVAIVLDDMTERKRLEAQRRLLERMVSPAVLDQINPDSLQMGGQERDITVLFADIRGFTTYSEKHTPEDLVAVLNRYLAAGAEAVLEQEGTVDKFLGDAVMAWFNAPLPQPDHTLRAVRAALALKAAVEKLHVELPPEAHLSFGVGIHYGKAVLGWIGTEKRLEFTAIGDSVNTAKRIQENAAKSQILISKAAYERVKKQIEASPYAPLNVKGKSEAVDVYEVNGLK
ncbi:MAG TPA: adenylate/guanylate cyclase domain-containing protein [Anaerolineales bacterium]|nr:adenylate/guanylate cyclase domain-containing protein [Anaerolineales bacterium]